MFIRVTKTSYQDKDFEMYVNSEAIEFFSIDTYSDDKSKSLGMQGLYTIRLNSGKEMSLRIENNVELTEYLKGQVSVMSRQ